MGQINTSRNGNALDASSPMVNWTSVVEVRSMVAVDDDRGVIDVSRPEFGQQPFCFSNTNSAITLEGGNPSGATLVYS